MRTFRCPPILLGEFDFVPTAEIPPKVQVLRAGTFTHPEYGTFEIKRSDLEKMVQNFSENVRKIDIAIDFGHAAEKEAAGWIKELFLQEGEGGVPELWATVLWTPNGKQSLVDRQYRYLSADFSFSYKDNETLKEYGPTLFGAGLTNRPVVKAMAPVIELSEGKGNPEMDEKDQMIEQLKAQIAELLKAKEGYEAEMGEMKKKLGEYEAGSKKAEEEKVAAEVALAEKLKGDEFNKLMSEGKACEAQRDAFMKDDLKTFTKLAMPLHLAAVGHGQVPAEGTKTPEQAEEEILKLAEEKQKADGKLRLSDALSQVLFERKDLAKLYRSKEGE